MLRHLYFYTYIDRPFPQLRDVLGGDPGRWLPPPAAPDPSGWTVELDADGRLPDGLATREAVVAVDSPLTAAQDDAVLRAITWRAATHDGWFPTFEGDVELAEVTTGTCQLSLRGTYRPPLSVVGAVGDRIVGHRVAEAVVRGFVLAVAERLERDAA